MDPVALAFANANQHRVGLDALDQKQRQVGQDTLQAANMFRSWGDRAQALEQQKRQFDVTQDLRERQFALNQEQSMAQLAGAKIQQDREALSLREQKQKLDEQPMRDAANATLYSSLSNVTDEPQLQDAYRKVTSDPLVAKYIPPQQLQSTFLSAKQSLLMGQEQILSMQNATKDQEVRNEYLRLGGRLEDVTTDGGKIDYNVLKMATGELQRIAASKDLAAKTAADIEKISARGAESIKALQARIDQTSARISDVTDRKRYDRKMQLAVKAYGDGNSSDFERFSAEADAIFTGSATPSAPTSTQSATIAVNPKTGERLQFNGKSWVPVK